MNLSVCVKIKLPMEHILYENVMFLFAIALLLFGSDMLLPVIYMLSLGNCFFSDIRPLFENDMLLFANDVFQLENEQLLFLF